MLFDTIPSTFFTPLAAPNRIMYWDCIYRLFVIMQGQISFGVERDILVDELQYYFDEITAAEADDEEFSTKDSRGKANLIIRKLENYGWITIETDKNYVQKVNFNDFSIQMIKTLNAISDGNKTEYQGYIYTIYNLVRAGGDNQGLGLMQIMENTDLLVTGLKNLNSNIKRYIDDLTKHSTVAELMDALFNDYITNIVDKAYHRLLTSDNVSKFRPEIIERLESKSRSTVFINAASKEISELKDFEIEEAKESVYKMLHEVIETFRNMDDILDDINKKNTQYQRAAINRARFLLSGNEDVRGQLKDILIYMNDRINEDNLDYASVYDIEHTDTLIKLYNCFFIDGNSFYTPIEGTKVFMPAPIEDYESDEELRHAKLIAMKEKLDRVLSVEKINGYVKNIMGDNNVISAKQVPLSCDEEFIKLIYIRLYGQRKNMNYKVVIKEKVNVGGYRFTDFEIWKK